MNYSLYDQLAFVLPGGLIVAAVIAGGWGWPWSEPGVAVMAGLTAVAYLVGHVNAALARWLAPLFLGRLPGTSPPPTWGLFGDGGFDESDRDVILAHLDRLAPGLSFEAQYAVAYTRLQQTGRDGYLHVLNGQIGFYRNSATAAIVATAILIGWQLAGEDHVALLPGAVVGIAVSAAYVSGYRRFWRRFGRQILRGVLAAGPQGLVGSPDDADRDPG